MLKLVVSWLVPTDHRRAAGVFLGCSLTMLVVGGAFAARIRIPEQPTHGPGEWDHGSRQQAHALILAHFALIPLLFLVAGVSMTPWLTGRTGVVFPKLLAVNVPIHVAACAAVLVASLADAPESYRDVENRLSRPFALVQASLLLAAINLLVTVLFRKNRHSPEHRSPVLAAAIATASVLVGVTWVVSAGSWMGAAIRILPNERTWNSWENPWPEFERSSGRPGM